MVYTKLYQFGTIKIYGDKQSKDGRSDVAITSFLVENAMMGSNESFDITNPILDNEIVQIYYINHDAYIQRADDCGKQMASTALDFIPVVGEAKAGIETVYEKDLITGYEYSDGERVFMGSCILFAEYVKLLGKVDDVGEIVKHADDLTGTKKQYSLFGEMSDVEGETYEEFLRRGSQEGFTEEELNAIARVDDQLALNKTKYGNSSGSAAYQGGSGSNQYCLSGDDHFEAYKEMFGEENVEWVTRDTLSSADRLRIDNWKFKPSDDGFQLETKIDDAFIKEGTIFKRYGDDSGEFLGNATDSFESRSLAPHSEYAEEHYYKLTEDYNMSTGKAAPWFGSDGGADQFVKYKADGSKYSIKELEDMGILKDITKAVRKGEIKID